MTPDEYLGEVLRERSASECEYHTPAATLPLPLLTRLPAALFLLTLDNAGKGVEKDVLRQRNSVRRFFKSCFPRRFCSTLRRPVHDEEALQKLPTIAYKDLRPEFQDDMEHLKQRVLHVCWLWLQPSKHLLVLTVLCCLLGPCSLPRQRCSTISH